MRVKNLVLIVLAASLLLAVIGCSSGDQEAANPPAADSATKVAETHDCDGGCGMTAVPADQMTEVGGKYYCGGCVIKAKEEAGEKAEDSHEGHSHG